MSDLVEEWRPVTECPHGKFWVSNLGRVKGVRKINALRCSHRGYPLFSFWCCGTKTVTVHSMVARAFIGPRPQGMTINHIDGCKTNNRADNLEYVSPTENIRHAIANGLKPAKPRPPHYSGERNSNAKLTEMTVLSARVATQLGLMSRKAILSATGISPSTLCAAITGKRWGHITRPPPTPEEAVAHLASLARGQ